MSSFTRLRRGVVSTILIAACVLAACSSDDDPSDGSSAAEPTVTTDAEATPATTEGGETPPTEAPSGEGPSGTLRAATYNAPTSLDAHLLGLGQNIQFAQPVYETLIRKLPDGSYVPMLATEWSYLDDERLLLEFKLRDDVDFTDGAHFDANAVKLSFDRFKTDFPEGNALIAALEEVEVVDDYTVHLHLSSPMPSILLTLSTNPTGSIISPDAIDNEDLSINPVGSGPYIFDQDSFVEGSFYAYDANPDYRDKSIQGLERIEYTVIEDLDARYNAIVADQVDIAPGMPEQIEDAEAAGLKIVQHPVDWYGVLFFDRDGTINPALGDPRVRQAMNYAVNRQEIVDTILGGAGQITSQIYPPGSPARDESLNEYYTYDPDKARALLAEAGYPDGFEFKSPVTPGNRVHGGHRRLPGRGGHHDEHGSLRGSSLHRCGRLRQLRGGVLQLRHGAPVPGQRLRAAARRTAERARHRRSRDRRVEHRGRQPARGRGRRGLPQDQQEGRRGGVVPRDPLPGLGAADQRPGVGHGAVRQPGLDVDLQLADRGLTGC